MNPRILILVIAIAVILGYLFLPDREGEKTLFKETAVYDTDTVIEGDYVVLPEEQTTLKDGATLTIEGDLTVDGAIGCSDSPLTIVAEGRVTINDTVFCEHDNEEDTQDIVIVAPDGIVMGDNAEVVGNGSIQIVDSLENVLSREALDALYDDVPNIPEEGQTIGPFVEEEAQLIAHTDPGVNTPDKSGLLGHVINTAYAQDPVNPVISGRMRVNTPRKGVKQLVIFNFPRAQGLTVQNFELSGPDGRKGESDNGGSCNAKGKDGEDAFRFNATAPNLTVNNFTLSLGNGGEGGDAETTKDCDPGIAKGGNGGKSGNFRMTAGNKFEISGGFFVHPGRGGAGGGATAHGKDGEPTKKGGDANATGGDGADNKKKLSVSGTVGGVSNVEIGDVVGGFGGPASAEPGNGGAGEACGEKGGDGGKGTAKSGDGGDASTSLGGGARRMEFAQDIGGQGGVVESFGGKGGDGGSCDPTAKGGDGGDGGDASSKEGKGGSGDSGNAADGVVFDETGGDGGNGGDGCTEGKGGSGGSGDPEGEDGKDGKNLCGQEPKEESYIAPSPEGESLIDVIKFMDYYIYATGDNLERVPGHEPFCDGEHWHPGPGGAMNTMGYPTPDPDADGCGFGKTADVPVIQIPDPNAESAGREQSGGGRMIQVDPPTLIIPG